MKALTRREELWCGESWAAAVKLALKKWNHWLEGTADPFMISCGHKNLQYWKTATCPNLIQALWACLIFTLLNFMTKNQGLKEFHGESGFLLESHIRLPSTNYWSGHIKKSGSCLRHLPWVAAPTLHSLLRKHCLVLDPSPFPLVPMWNHVERGLDSPPLRHWLQPAHGQPPQDSCLRTPKFLALS